VGEMRDTGRRPSLRRAARRSGYPDRMSSQPLFSEFALIEYAKCLAQCTHVPIEVLQPEPGGVVSWLRDGEELRKMEADDPV
jgi:hypothetical protein